MADHSAPPVVHRSKTYVWLWILIAALLLSAVGVIAYMTRETQAVTVAQTSNGVKLCDPGAVEVYPTTESGVTLFVHSVAPNVLTVDVWDAFNHRRLTQQVTLKGEGARFSMWGDFMFRYRRIEVTAQHGGVCTVSADVINRLNKAQGWN